MSLCDMDFKVNIYLDDFSFLSKSMMQQPPIQLSQLNTIFIGMKTLILH
jgi:hypothetical protein